MRELWQEFALAKERRAHEHDRDVTLAWSIAALTRGTKGLPKLSSLLMQKPGHRQTAREQVAMWQFIAARFGGTFTPVTEAH